MEKDLVQLAEFVLHVAAHQMATRHLLWEHGYTDQQYEQALTEARAKLNLLPTVRGFRESGGSSILEPLLVDVKTTLDQPLAG